MSKVLIVVNDMSGNSAKIDVDSILRTLSPDDEVYQLRLLASDQDYDVSGYDEVIACGGDGTINNAINKCRDLDLRLVCYPSGTLNEKSRAMSDAKSAGRRISHLGMANGQLFTYVMAAGAFTEIGYTARPRHKKRFKALAYVWKAFSAYRVYDIEAKIFTDRRTIENTRFALIMVLDSDRCFGFRFNRMYKASDEKTLYLLAIKNTGKNTLRGKIRMLFPFFRAFFMGFRREHHSRLIDFMPLEKVDIQLGESQDFCVDGECRNYSGFVHVEKKRIKPELIIRNEY